MNTTRHILCLLLCLLPLAAGAQRKVKKDLAEAHTYIKNGTNYDKAENLMVALLKDSANRDNEKIWLTLFEAIKKQYDEGNEKLYLKQKYDTTQLFSNTRKMFRVLMYLDSIDARPGADGQPALRYRKKHADFLAGYRSNIYNGGLLAMNKQDDRDAFDYFDLYINSARHPMFARFLWADTDTLLPRAAYLAAAAAFRAKQYAAALRHTELARRDTARAPALLLLLAETHKATGDTARYEDALAEGFHRFPKQAYFFPRLFDRYMQHGRTKDAMKICDEGLQTDSTDTVFRYARNVLLFQEARYDECIATGKALIADSCRLADLWLNVGLSYYRKAVEIDCIKVKTRQQRQQMQQLYRDAMPYMQEYRRREPTEQKKWLVPLYYIYYNLNMGPEFEEISAMMK